MYKNVIKLFLLVFTIILSTCTLGVISTNEGEKKETNNKTAEEIEAEEDFEWLLTYVDADLAVRKKASKLDLLQSAAGSQNFPILDCMK